MYSMLINTLVKVENLFYVHVFLEWDVWNEPIIGTHDDYHIRKSKKSVSTVLQNKSQTTSGEVLTNEE